MKCDVYVTLKNGVLDPQGKAINHALHAHNFNDVIDVRVNKMITLEFNHDNEEQIRKEAKEMCEELLANTVIEDYRVELHK